MKKQSLLNPLALALIITYSLIVMCLGIVQKPLTANEAQNIYMGRAILSEGALACDDYSEEDDHAALKKLMCAYAGSVSTAPLINAIMDGFAGFYLARLVGLILCLLLILLIYQTANTVYHGRKGLMAAAVFVMIGIPLYLSSAVTADALAAFFFGLALMLIESGAERETTSETSLILVSAALALSVAAITNYVVILFLVSVVVYVFLRYRITAGLFFLLPLCVILLLYSYFAVIPAWPFLKYPVHFSVTHLNENTSIKFNYIYEWLALPYLVATFGMFHKENGKKAALLMLLSAPAFLIPFTSNDIAATHSVVLLFLILIIPAVAIGVEHMGELFSSNNQMSFIKPLFITAVLVIVFVFGIQQMKKLQRDCPNLSPAITFFEENSISGTTILVDSDFGWPEYLYRYFLETDKQSVRIVPNNDTDRENVVAKISPDYVVMDEYYSSQLSFEQASLQYAAQGFTPVKNYRLKFSAGFKNIIIFQKGAL